MELIRKEVSELEDGDYIGDNVERNKAVIVKRGVKVTEKLKKRLESLGIKRVTVFRYEEEEDESKNNGVIDDEKKDRKKKKYHAVTDVLLEQLFDETLFEVAHERRYGFSLQTKEDFNYVKQLFIVIAKNGDIYENLIHLKEWDYYSFVHTFDVFVLISLFSRYLNVNNRYDISKAGLLYDLGKVHVPQNILQKSNKLSEEEMNIVKKHTLWGANMLPEDVSQTIRNMVLNHHEHLSGTGYPNQIAADQIDYSTRILTIVDVYSALTLKRADRVPLTAPKALEYLIKNKFMFDEDIAGKFISFLKIYPLNSTVKLNNNKKAKVISIYDNAPHLPHLKEIYTKYSYNVPSNLSVTVSEFLSWEEHMIDEVKWGDFIKALLVFNEKRSYQIFKEICVDKKTDDIYTDIIMVAIEELKEASVDPAICDRIFLKWMKEKTALPFDPKK